MADQSQDTSIDSLLDQLQNSKDTFVQRWAADLLGERGKDNEQVLGTLRNIAQSDPSEPVRLAAKSALRKLGEEIEEQPTNWWQAVGIGALVGWLTLLILFTIDGNSWAGIISFLGAPFGIVGALVGRHFGKNLLSTFIGSMVGTILVAGSCLFLLSTCMFGC